MVQSQIITIYNYNSLLNKIDNDVAFVGINTFYNDLKMINGDNLRTKIISLASKLDDAVVGGKISPPTPYLSYTNMVSNKSGSVTSMSIEEELIITSSNHGLFTGRIIQITGSASDPDLDGFYEVTVLDNNSFSIKVTLKTIGVITGISWSTATESYADIAACYNKIVTSLNLDNKVGYSNYQVITDVSIQETTIIDINRVTKTLTLSNSLPYIQGPITIYSAISSNVVYSPTTFGDPLSFKHVREATALFANKAFTSATMSFSTDLLPVFIDVPFEGDGKGLFGHENFGSNFFGGNSNSIPFRTYVPKNCQRCRYLNIKFSHKVAREEYALFGITLTGRTVSTRAYR